MTAPKSSSYSGWVAIMSAVATVAMLITAILTSSLNLGNTFRLFVLALMALIILVALSLHLRLRSLVPSLSLAAAAVAILGALLTAAAHVLQIASAISEAEFNTLGEGIGPAAIGMWLLLANYVARQGRAFPRGLAWVGLIAGAGYLASFDSGTRERRNAEFVVVDRPVGDFLHLPRLGGLVGRLDDQAGKAGHRISSGR